MCFGDEYQKLNAESRARFENNAHVRREPFDAEILVLGDEGESQLYDRAIPLGDGIDANRIVMELSSDSGKGPWYLRPMEFGEEATSLLLETAEHGTVDSLLS